MSWLSCAITSSTDWPRFCTIRRRFAPGCTVAFPPAFLTTWVIQSAGVIFALASGPSISRSRLASRDRAVTVASIRSARWVRSTTATSNVDSSKISRSPASSSPERVTRPSGSTSGKLISALALTR